MFCPDFRPWELEDAVPRLKTELALFNQNQSAKLMDALHAASFRGGNLFSIFEIGLNSFPSHSINSLFCHYFLGLSHSLFINPSLVGKMKSEQLHHYCLEHITGPRTVISAMGVDHERLVHLYKKLEKLSSSSADDASNCKFNPNGGEVSYSLIDTTIYVIAIVLLIYNLCAFNVH